MYWLASRMVHYARLDLLASVRGDSYAWYVPFTFTLDSALSYFVYDSLVCSLL
jgi:hypothetical protein